MRANVGDRLIIKGHSVGDPDRDAEILEVRGPDGGAPYVVRWDDSGHETLFFPGPDATVQHLGPVEEVVPVGSAADLIRDEDEELLQGVQRLLDAADALDDGRDVLPDAVHEAHAFLDADLLPRLAIEVEEAYPVIDELVGTSASTAPMVRQYVEVQRLAARLGRLRDEATTGLTVATRRNLRQVLHALHALLTVHLAIQQELYVPLLGAKLPPRRSGALATAMLEAARRRSTSVAAVEGSTG